MELRQTAVRAGDWPHALRVARGGANHGVRRRQRGTDGSARRPTASCSSTATIVAIGDRLAEHSRDRARRIEGRGRYLGLVDAHVHLESQRRCIVAKISIVLLTSIWFGLAHYSVQGVAGTEQATIVGLVFGTIFALTGRLFMLMIAHAAFDLTAYGMIYWNFETTVAHFVFK